MFSPEFGNNNTEQKRFDQCESSKKEFDEIEYMITG